ncbi:undecaprenyldiphospho-muramoylpentapeptide beta-N-acetylglucosaminyltransferase [Lederbergia citrea]|uniref:UDP-N-acetylglucosamine--N-acetylmuramyl-(pentapeptide) pyrophosphoryl-undecaprenol N-acetylglucosamine transferase n=1 Tax=Lederbergia citrea TaxID=2833581 RepID=A0A942Z1E0_9BACI|nr:undecaprenyldiphospho-muramoylpentapeptide beta-N-acetylglucosaminyltransferase [Lederbergia citrea]MBS4177354.1 undecaprenyldiphospho-muramoylpentapeptide beta-N-acetylglucosaminyltransferase [Lederbergia citrea]MBS4204017.1 undecaprenyldiphospho-muramoylpentapeptide beta-N-acetylglucosaminyltransferase [Lederbergia citrea]MBS4221398.1 undecaprenyldiphospho-muramoylpentapeptide beta-N-acetylglucosaminyltransferase [Lederbergia citrea]
MNSKNIVFTGGGSAGHVTPNIAIMEALGKHWNVHYIGSFNGIEKEIIERTSIPYNGISSGKLRRYMSKENVLDIGRVVKGFWQARRLLKKIKPKLVFSKGGFVTVPVVLAAKSLGIPVYLHESDMTPGLANRIAMRFSKKIFTSFEEAASHFPKEKTTVVGSPVRKLLFEGNASKGKRFLGFEKKLPILTIMGGSLGAKRINEEVRGLLPALTKQFQIVHICGKGQIDRTYLSHPGYRQFEYISEELPDILAATNLVLTRGGSNSIFEFLSLRIPMLIIPLTLSQSRGDQILNAISFRDKGYSLMLEEENLTQEVLLGHIIELREKSEQMKKAMAAFPASNGVASIVEAIEKTRYYK